MNISQVYKSLKFYNLEKMLVFIKYSSFNSEDHHILTDLKQMMVNFLNMFFWGGGGWRK